MSRTSTKSAGRTSKATAETRKKATKSAKSARKSVKKPAESRRRVAKPARRAARAKSAPIKVIAAKSIAVKVVETVSGPAVAAIMAEASIMRTLSPPMQPGTPESVHAHKYRVGETVYYTSPSFGRAAASGSYTVVKLLPSDGDDYQYRIKSSGEAFERVAKESQLDRA
jgi:hypothetical protein